MSDEGAARSLIEHLSGLVESGMTLGAAVEAHLRGTLSPTWTTRPDERRQSEWKEEVKLRLLQSAKRRAEKKGLEFSIGREDIPIPETCPVLGIQLEEPRPGTGFTHRERSPSLDRIDSSRGYVPGNVAVISWRANSLKRDATPEELRRLADWAAFAEAIPPPDLSSPAPRTSGRTKSC